MTKKQVVTLVIVAVIVVVGIVVGVTTRQKGVFIRGDEKGRGVVEEITAPTGEAVPVFTSEVPAGAEPTEPAISAPAAPDRTEKLNIFNMAVSAAGYEPDSITVKKGDIMTIRLTAQGGTYDVQIPYTGHYAKVSNGETKEVSVGMNTAGTYTFLCRDFCPQGRTISGSIIVLP